MIKTFKCPRCQDEFENPTWDPIEKAWCPRCGIEMRAIRELKTLRIIGELKCPLTRDEKLEVMDRRFKESVILEFNKYLEETRFD